MHGARSGDCARGCATDRPSSNTANRAAERGRTPVSSPTPARGLNREQWLDRKTIAVLMGRDEDTVRRVQRENVLPTRSGPNNCVLLCLGDLIDLDRIPASVLDPQINAKDVADAILVRRELEDLRCQHAELLGRLGAHQDTLDLLRAHVATQNAFIADLRAARTVAETA
jgi:hypothetical protein